MSYQRAARNGKKHEVVPLDVEFNPKQEIAKDLLLDMAKKFYMFFGGSRSGKTFLVCYFIRHRARRYPGSKHLVARYSFANAKKTIWIQTLYPLLRKDEEAGLCTINQQEGICRYYNGSIVMLGGLEPSRIDSVLAAEYGTIFITEANENRYKDIEMLFSRLNDTAVNEKGEMIPLKFIVDLNPTVKTHWTNVLFRLGMDPVTGKPKENYHEFTFLHFRPEDNEKNLAIGYIDTLTSLSPAMRKRFYEGEFGAYEGLVYQIDEPVHVVDDFEIPDKWPKGQAIDFGFTHPFASLWGAMDEANETLYIYRNYKVVRTTVRVHSGNLKALTTEKISWVVADHDAEDRATLNENGIDTIPADKEVLAGIDNVIDLLSYENKRPQIKIFRSCVDLITEMFGYRWKESATAIQPKDREVVKEDDDLCDCLRYLVMKFFPERRRVAGVIYQSPEEYMQVVEKQKQSEQVAGIIMGRR